MESDPTDMTKKKRVSFSPMQKKCLEEHYSRGMTSTRDKQKIAEVAQQLGVTVTQVEVFIGNNRRKEKGSAVPAKPGMKKPVMQGPNAYSFFCRQRPKGEQDNASYFKGNSQCWRDLPADQKEFCKTEAAKIRQDPNKGCDRDVLVKYHFNTIQSTVNKLDELGYTIGGLALDGEEPPVVFGSSKCFGFFKTLLYKFEETFRPGLACHPPPVENKNDLEMEVRKIYKAKWCDAVGKRQRLPYMDILKLKTTGIEVQGLPAGVKFDSPSNYGIRTLKEVIKAAPNISIRILHQNSLSAGGSQEQPSQPITLNETTNPGGSQEQPSQFVTLDETTNPGRSQEQPSQSVTLYQTTNIGGSQEQPSQHVTLNETTNPGGSQEQPSQPVTLNETTNPGGSQEQPSQSVTLNETTNPGGSQEQPTQHVTLDEITNPGGSQEKPSEGVTLDEITNPAQLDKEDLKALLPLLIPNATIEEESSDEQISVNLKSEEQISVNLKSEEQKTDDAIYNVEVLKYRKRKGQREALVKWENCEGHEWIPASQFVNTSSKKKRRKKKV